MSWNPANAIRPTGDGLLSAGEIAQGTLNSPQTARRIEIWYNGAAVGPSNPLPITGGSGSGIVSGPGASTVGAVALWNNTTGTLLANSSILSNGTQLGIGTGTAAAIASSLHIVDTVTTNPRGALYDQYNNGTNSSQINVRKARGTFATPLTIVTGDVLSRFISWGHDGTGFIESGNLRFTSEGTIATNRVPSNFGIWVNTNAGPSVLTQTASFSGSAGIALTAIGTNSNITLTPSGIGGVSVVGGDDAMIFNVRRTTASTATRQNVGSYIAVSTGDMVDGFGSASAFYIRDTAGADNLIGIIGAIRSGADNSGSLVGIVRNAGVSATAWIATPTQHLLLGGLGTDGTAVLQFPNHSTNDGGIALGTGAFIFALTSGGEGIKTSGSITPQKVITASAPAYVEGKIYYDTTLHKLRVGGASVYETITSV